MGRGRVQQRAMAGVAAPLVEHACCAHALNLLLSYIVELHDLVG